MAGGRGDGCRSESEEEEDIEGERERFLPMVSSSGLSALRFLVLLSSVDSECLVSLWVPQQYHV